MADTWPERLTNGEHVGQALDWVRWKTEGRALMMVAIGVNSVVVAKDRNLNAEDAIELLTKELDVIARLVRDLHASKKTHGAKARPQR